jgi:hypothetical protein
MQRKYRSMRQINGSTLKLAAVSRNHLSALKTGLSSTQVMIIKDTGAAVEISFDLKAEVYRKLDIGLQVAGVWRCDWRLHDRASAPAIRRVQSRQPVLGFATSLSGNSGMG